jgi:hypothetical protein
MNGLPQVKPLAVTIPGAVQISGIGRTVLYEHIRTGRLPILKSGRRTLVRVDALDALLRSLEVSNAASGSAGTATPSVLTATSNRRRLGTLPPEIKKVPRGVS